MKKNGIFWKLYMLFFAVPFPMILYYSIRGSQQEPADTSPVLITVYLIISVISWALLMFFLFKSWVLNVFKIYARINKLLLQGTPVTATVTDSASKGPSRQKDNELLDVTLTFPNLAGEMVSERMEINDSKPHEHRYDTGQRLNLRLDPELNLPYLLPESTQTYLNKKTITLRVLGWLLLLVAVTGYYWFSYSYEGRSRSWSFLIFWHPLIICPLILFLYKGLIGGLLNKYFGRGKDDLRLKFYGKKTMARLRNASQTGLTINDQPQVLFEMEYTDAFGKKYTTSFKKIVSLLDLGIAKQEMLEIFYLPDAPHIVALAGDLE
jgi:hypothetical protein